MKEHKNKRDSGNGSWLVKGRKEKGKCLDMT